MVKNLKNKAGFTLIEVLVGLLLMTIVLAVAVSFSDTPRQALDEGLSNLERAIRFSGDEAVLRNAIIRIHFYLDKTPQEYAVEYGPNDSFVLPASDLEKSSGSISDDEKKKKETEELNLKFNKIKEFQSSNMEMPERVKVIGIGTSLQDKLITDYHASIYIYPTGEKDSAIIILGTDEEVASLSITPFTSDFENDYLPLEEVDPENIGAEQISKAEELYKNWLKKQ